MVNYIIGVKFDDCSYSKEYDFKYECEVIDIGIGDKVVVETRHGLQIATVKTVIRLAIGETYERATAWVIQKIDMTTHNRRKFREKEAKKLKARLEERRQQLEDSIVYNMLAQSDPEFAKLLSDYTRLVNS
ncbi:hypothetical protein SECTIM467_110 [Brevibacillus phage SecTim467]|uniref:Uncharacterized protein n=2 Tax=Jenstvirus jenst TaxID=1982225 RepID=A0A0K2CPG2_9CAUD|nr:hypothetical protein AVV11_gp086 [Brevibacillus phage Jenst]ALA07234.1 hypothetical protein JENST_105 [Brevibacillus phage Jenst]ALA07449.1 hypothetical protein SECTIM467_110 [Brevibacillus phage SecTim467]